MVTTDLGYPMKSTLHSGNKRFSNTNWICWLLAWPSWALLAILCDTHYTQWQQEVQQYKLNAIGMSLAGHPVWHTHTHTGHPVATKGSAIQTEWCWLLKWALPAIQCDTHWPSSGNKRFSNTNGMMLTAEMSLAGHPVWQTHYTSGNRGFNNRNWMMLTTGISLAGHPVGHSLYTVATEGSTIQTEWCWLMAWALLAIQCDTHTGHPVATKDSAIQTEWCWLLKWALLAIQCDTHTGHPVATKGSAI